LSIGIYLVLVFWNLPKGDILENKGASIEQIIDELKTVSEMDFHFATGRILGSMYTEPHEVAKKAHMMFMEANLGNPDLYPGTKQLESEVIRMLGELLHNPEAHGQVLGGGTESNITALWIARKLTGKTEVVFPKSTHFSIMKAVDLLKLTPIEIELDEKYQMDVSEVEDKISDNTAAVFANAGTTELGVIDPVEKLSDICQEKTFLHVDAVFGGFVIPFLKELGFDTPGYDFKLPGVSTISIDPHKMGFSTIPSGALLYPEKEFIKTIEIEASYLISIRHAALSGTRASAGVASAYAVMKHLGRNGYRDIVKNCMDSTFYLKERAGELGLNLVREPVMNILGFEMKNPGKVQKELFKLNWHTSKGRFPCCLRVVCMPHVTREVIDTFIPDLKAVCEKVGEI
jgi:tyrosine decarboxylase/aspartate 1-decarboxylase